jgi:two-component system response regulator HupR/HoxA
VNSEHTVLVVSSDDAVIDLARRSLEADGDYRIVVCRSEREGLQRLGEIEVHLLLSDCDLTTDPGSSLAVTARVSHPRVPRVVIASPDAAAMGTMVARHAAAYLFLVKPIMAEQIALVAKRALELTELSRRHRVLSRELRISMDDNIFAGEQEMSVKGGVSQFEKLVYASPKMAELTAEARQAAATELPVLIHGETGTGKELLARAVHFNSPRMNSPLHVQNCGGVSDATLHSELFGHVRGAFTGAIADRLGLFRAANGGTVFLDEISEISKSFQVSLLRFLQEGEVKPLGSDKVDHADVRIIAASNRRLDKLVESGDFRRDLYYRLKGFALNIPPLRERREDISVLAAFFLDKYAGVVGRRVIGITNTALEKLNAYDYPGNVRELETEVRRMVAIAEHGGYISERHLSPAFEHVRQQATAPSGLAIEGATLKEMVETLERQVVKATLDRCRWNQSRAADDLGLSRVGLANKIKRYDLQGT